MRLNSFKDISMQNKKQSGFLLPVALFMIVISSGVALVLLKQVVKPSNNLTTSSIAAKSVYAAKLGAELASHQLFFPAAIPSNARQQMDSRCENSSVNPTINLDGLHQCRLVVSCECRYESGVVCDSTNNGNYNDTVGVENSFYRIQSEVSCGAGFAQGYYRFELNKKSP